MSERQDIDRAGDFRGQIIEYGLTEKESGAVAVTIDARLEEWWNPERNDWDDWRGYQVYAQGYLWIIKKDGKLNETQVKALAECTGWDGSLDSIVKHTFEPLPCQFSIGEETYNEQLRYRIDWLNDYGRIPGGMGVVAPDRLKQLSLKYGSSLRAVAGSVKQTPKPAGGPKAPPRANPPPSNRNTEPVAAAKEDDSDIPF